jgi:predicted MPP superfamily phosphohydrolase
MRHLSRRTFLTTMATASAGASGLCVYACGVEPHWVEFVEHTLPIPGLPVALAGKRLVQLSDLHIGPRVSDDYVREVCARVDQLGADLVAYTGDFICHHDRIFDQVARMFPVLPRGRLATVGVLGNHDYGPGWSRPDIADGVTVRLADQGVHILRNEQLSVAGLDILGVDDLWARRARIAPTLNLRRPGAPALVLCHNPDAVDAPEWGDYAGWILSGHTHGGQCRPPFLPPPLLPVQNQRYTAGVFDLDERRTLYINRGVGHLLQARFNVRPEVTVFTLRAG